MQLHRFSLGSVDSIAVPDISGHNDVGKAELLDQRRILQDVNELVAKGAQLAVQQLKADDNTGLAGQWAELAALLGYDLVPQAKVLLFTLVELQ